MNDDEAIINTLETLGVTPRFALQHNAISRSANNFSAIAKKLTAMAMALLPADLSSLSAAFTFTEFCTALDEPKGGKTFILFQEAVKECMDSTIKVETPPDKKGKTSWIMFHWFQFAEFNKDTGVCTMTFDQKLSEFLKELKRVYAKINLQDIGKLQSKYALRYFEIAKSYESLAGKDGNRDGTWYFERTIPELRKLLAIPEDSYPKTSKFRERIIEEPVKEINNAGIGITIETIGIKQGRNLKGIRFDCNRAARLLPVKRGRGRPRKNPVPDEQLTLPEAALQQTREEKELERLRERYPDEFAALYAEEMAKPSFLPSENNFRRTAAVATALIALRTKHGVVK